MGPILTGHTLPPPSELTVNSYPPFEPDERDVERCREQWQGYAELALRRHNKNKSNKVKYSLVELIDGELLFEDGSEMLWRAWAQEARPQ